MPRKATCIIVSGFQSIKKSHCVFREAFRERQVLHLHFFVSQTRMVSEAGQLIVDASPFKSLSVTMILLSHLFLVSPGNDDGWTDEWTNLSLSFSPLFTLESRFDSFFFYSVEYSSLSFCAFVGNKVWHFTAFFFFIMKSNGVDHSSWKESKGENMILYLSLFFGRWIVPQVLVEKISLVSKTTRSLFASSPSPSKVDSPWIRNSLCFSLFESVTDKKTEKKTPWRTNSLKQNKIIEPCIFNV